MKQSASQRESLTKAAKHYHSALEVAEGYLLARGLTIGQATRMGLGVVQEPLTGHEQYRGRLSIPYVTKSGVVDLRFRSLDPSVEPKYMGLTGATTHLYNVGALFKAASFISICEGEIDTITMDCAVGIPAVGVPGVNNWKPHYTRLFADFEHVFLFADGDSAGTDFAKSLAKELNNLTIVQMPDGEDVNSMYQSQGSDYFIGKVEKVINVDTEQ